MCFDREFQKEREAMESSVAPGLVFGSEWRREEVCIRGVEAVGGSVAVEQVSEVMEGLIIQMPVGVNVYLNGLGTI